MGQLTGGARTGLRLIPVVLGLVGMPLGIALGALAGRFTEVHFGLLTLSLLSIGGGLLWLREARLRETLAAIVYSIFFLLCVALVYLISANRQVRFDLTEDRLHSLDPLSEAVVAQLPQDEIITLTVFAPAQEHQSVARFLENYTRPSPAIRTRIYDAGRDLDAALQFGGAVEERSLFLTVQGPGGEIIHRAPPEAFDVSSPFRENTLTNALLRAQRPEGQKIYYSMSHGEKRVDETEFSLSRVIRIVNDSILPVEPLRLTENAIPEDAAALIIAGPTIDLFDFERELLSDYLNQGGKLLLLLDPVLDPVTAQPRPLENFQALLGEYGLQSPNAMIVDPTAVNAFQSNFTPLVNWTAHPIAQGTNKTPFYLDRARPLESAEELPKGIKLEGILVTSDQTWVEPLDQLRSIRRLNPPEDPDQIDLQIAAVTARRPTPGGRRGETMRLVVMGDSEAFVDGNLVQNGDAALFFRQSITWLREQDELLQIPPRALSSTPITMTLARLWTILGGLMFLGLLITVGGTSYAIYRRRTR